MHICARPDCNEIGKRACSACRTEYYCSAECQKGDWKAHKIMCHLIKMMPSNMLLPFLDICSVLDEVLNQTAAQIVQLGRKKHVRLLEYLLAFAKHQFGEQVADTLVYDRGNDDHINAWDMEVGVFHSIYSKLVKRTLYNDNNDYYWLSGIDYIQKTVSILEPWSLNEGERFNSLNEDGLEWLFDELSDKEKLLALAHENLNDWDKAQYYYKQSNIHAKKMKEKGIKNKKIRDILCIQGALYLRMLKLSEGKACMQEAYMIASEAYDPDPPLVIETANLLNGIIDVTEDRFVEHMASLRRS